jgi:hypothetical protein
MYHIPNDPRALKSAELIAEGLLSLSREKSLSHFSISSIQRASSVSRSTFYRLFDTPVDVLVWKVDQLFDGFAKRAGAKAGRDWIVSSFFRMVVDNADLFVALERCKRMDALVQNHQRYFSMIQKIFDLPEVSSAAEREYLVNMMSYLLLVAVSTWIRRGQRDTPEQVHAYFWKSIRAIAELEGGK